MPAVSTVTVDVRCWDIDATAEILHAVSARYPETACTSFFTEHLGIVLTDAPTVLASLRIDYHAPITRGDAIAASWAVERAGRTSIPITFTIRADGTDCATATTVQVALDAVSGAAAPMLRGTDSERWRRTRRDLNPRHPGPEPGTLSTELRALGCR